MHDIFAPTWGGALENFAPVSYALTLIWEVLAKEEKKIIKEKGQGCNEW